MIQRILYKCVNRTLFLLAISCSLLNLPQIISVPLFYIYEWPDELIDVWPPLNNTLHEGSPYSHSFRGNNGAGKLVQGDIGYFSTWQFALFHLTLARLRVSQYRTLDPANATAFIIPFDLGAHSFVDHINGRARIAAPHGWRAHKWLRDRSKSSIFWKNHGHDHFVIFAITSYQIIGIGAKNFLIEICTNCTVLTIETTPTNTARKYYIRRSRKHWYAVPYPSSFHWWEGIAELPWKRADGLQSRPYFSIFIGSVDTLTPQSNKLRKALQRDCKADSTGTCLWFDAAHSCSGVLNLTDGMLLYRKTQFCLTPTGDSLTRKSLFDSLTTGCIPVVFARATISQYYWHIPLEIADEISVFIPAEKVVKDSLNFLQVLRNISQQKIYEMQLKIEEIAPRLQYSVVPDGYGSTKAAAYSAYKLSQTGVIEFRNQISSNLSQAQGNNTEASSYSIDSFVYRGGVWQPPFPDAVDVIIDRILDKRTIEPIAGYTQQEINTVYRMNELVSEDDPDYGRLAYVPTSSTAKARAMRAKAEAMIAGRDSSWKSSGKKKRTGKHDRSHGSRLESGHLS